MKAFDFINKLRWELADTQGHAFTDDLLISFMNDGLCLIYQLRPELFSETKIIKANPGSVQFLSCCDRLVSVDEETDPCGNPKDFIRQSSVKMARSFNKAAIAPHSRTVSVNSKKQRQFEVHPPVYPNEAVFFRITCTSRPDYVQDLASEVTDCKHQEALMKYVLSRAYGMEVDSQSSQSVSKQLYNEMLQLLGLEKKIDNELVESNVQRNAKAVS